MKQWLCHNLNNSQTQGFKYKHNKPAANSWSRLKTLYHLPWCTTYCLLWNVSIDLNDQITTVSFVYSHDHARKVASDLKEEMQSELESSIDTCKLWIMCTNDTRDRVSIDSSDRHLDRPAIDTRSTSRSTLGRPSVDTRSTSRSTDYSSSSTLYRVALDTSDDHTFHVGRRVDRYLTVGCR